MINKLGFCQTQGNWTFISLLGSCYKEHVIDSMQHILITGCWGELQEIHIMRFEKIRTEEIRTRAGVADGSGNIREERLRWLGHVERKKEEDVAMRTRQRVDTE